MSNFIEPSKRIQFVKAREDYHSSEAKKQLKAEERKLNGKEVAAFYRELIAENDKDPSNSTIGNVAEEPKIKQVAKKRQQKVKLEPLTERDERLWFKAASTNDLPKCKELFERGIAIDSIDFWGSTALIVAVSAEANEVIEFLMQNGADWKFKNKAGLNSVDIARKKGFSEIAEYILSYGASNELQDMDSTEGPSSSTISCEHCNQTFNSSDIHSHYCSIVHIVNTSSQPKPGFAYGISSTNRGYQMLKESGWTEEKGLGKGEREGRKYPLKTILKPDRKGLGLNKLKPKITHFEAGDLEAIKAQPKLGKRSYFKALAEKKKREKAIDDKVRRAVSDFDEYPV